MTQESKWEARNISDRCSSGTFGSKTSRSGNDFGPSYAGIADNRNLSIMDGARTGGTIRSGGSCLRNLSSRTPSSPFLRLVNCVEPKTMDDLTFASASEAVVRDRRQRVGERHLDAAQTIWLHQHRSQSWNQLKASLPLDRPGPRARLSDRRPPSS